MQCFRSVAQLVSQMYLLTLARRAHDRSEFISGAGDVSTEGKRDKTPTHKPPHSMTRFPPSFKSWLTYIREGLVSVSFSRTWSPLNLRHDPSPLRIDETRVKKPRVWDCADGVCVVNSCGMRCVCHSTNQFHRPASCTWRPLSLSLSLCLRAVAAAAPPAA